MRMTFVFPDYFNIPIDIIEIDEEIERCSRGILRDT